MGGEQTHYSKTSPVCEAGGGSPSQRVRAGWALPSGDAWALSWAGKGLAKGLVSALGPLAVGSSHRGGTHLTLWHLRGKSPGRPGEPTKPPVTSALPLAVSRVPPVPTASHRGGTRKLQGCKSFVGTRSLSKTPCKYRRCPARAPSGTALASMADRWTEVAFKPFPVKRSGVLCEEEIGQ